MDLYFALICDGNFRVGSMVTVCATGEVFLNVYSCVEFFKMEAANSSATAANLYETTLRHI